MTGCSMPRRRVLRVAVLLERDRSPTLDTVSVTRPAIPGSSAGFTPGGGAETPSIIGLIDAKFWCRGDLPRARGAGGGIREYQTNDNGATEVTLASPGITRR